MLVRLNGIVELHSSEAVSRKSIKQLLMGLVLRSEGVLREGFFGEMTFELGLDFEVQGRLRQRQRPGVLVTTDLYRRVDGTLAICGSL